MPSMTTNANGGWSLSTTTLTRGSRTSVRPFTVPSPVVKITSSPSSTNHTGAACGRPSARVVATFAVRVPSVKNARRSSSVMVYDMHGPFHARLRCR